MRAITLGTEFANKRVTVAGVDVEATIPDPDDLAPAYRDAAASTRSLTDDWDHLSDEVWEDLPE